SVPVLVGDYVELLLWPSELNVYRAFEYPTSWWDTRVLIGVTVLLTGVSLLVHGWKRDRLWSVLLLWTAIPLLPVLYVPAMGDSVVAERYMYLSSVGFSLLVGAGFGWVAEGSPRLRRLGAALAGVM